MGRNPRNERIELDDDDRDDRATPRARKDRDDDRKAFEEPVFADAIESPLHIPRETWPEGHTLRWIRIEAGQADDNVNWSKMTRIGWQPVQRGRFPEIDAFYPQVAMPGRSEEPGGAIVFGGLCLCMRDDRLVARDRKRVEQETKEAMRTVENYVEGGNSMFPRFNQSGPLEVQNARTAARFKE